MTTDSWELNKVIPLIHVAVLKTATILDALAMVLGLCYDIPDLANAFLSVPWLLSHKINLIDKLINWWFE